MGFILGHFVERKKEINEVVILYRGDVQFWVVNAVVPLWFGLVGQFFVVYTLYGPHKNLTICRLF